ncbi:hypothetical protein ACM640_10900 [Lactiplantibacillus plantarum]|uniref:hypothetical protein n=1 Tax=Lactiplantibacillus TaxID=2767842 RepID=UPI001B3860AC|nr:MULTISPECIES: hypothetical protein [Lactiplantibacillus]MBQ0836540.1 hypothetical protein [Lactiplantibacillus pentosus]MBU7449066.1 hypothetical protein [Lactiplantibacillus sp. 7.2.4]MBU7481849.1 hypothetical protein [Lactiplantibacillus pentosus]USZ59971.1 hypothetical protein NHN12_10985 [Lactiplantibacillus plantarum]
MKRMIAIGMTILSVGMFSACSTNSNSPKSSNSSSHSKSNTAQHYKYYAKGKTFYGPKGTLKINKLIGYTLDNNHYFILDITYKNTTKKEVDASDIMTPNIEARQLNKDKSQKINLNGSNSASQYYRDNNNIDDYNKFNEITDSASNSLMPEKELHTLQEFSYKLNNNENDIELSLSDPDATSDDTVNPKKNKITIDINSIQDNSLNLNDYSTN